MSMRALFTFACLGHDKRGFDRAGHFEAAAFVEINPWRRARLARDFPGVPIHDDIHTYRAAGPVGVIVGGPPCQKTSVAAAVHGRRSGASLWPEMFRVGVDAEAEWFVVEQPTGNAQWEADVSCDLAGAGYHVARLEFEARDLGAPYERRRVFFLACPCLSRLEVAWSAGPSAVERVKRAADARGTWDPRVLRTLRVDARSAGERGRDRVEHIEALGDSNPPEMAEVIAHCIMATAITPEDHHG